jgi:hypothetical protein
VNVKSTPLARLAVDHPRGDTIALDGVMPNSGREVNDDQSEQ